MGPHRKLAGYVELTLITWIIALHGNVATKPTEFFSGNVHDLTNLALYDIKFTKELKDFRNSTAVNSLQNKTRRLIDNYLEVSREANGIEDVRHVEPQHVTGNPISVYRLIRRCSLFMLKIVKEAKESNQLYVARTVPPPLPGPNDLQDVADAILRIHSTYNSNVTQFADGALPGWTTKSQLRGIHCAGIGTRALDTGLHADAVEWFQEARRRAAVDRTVSLYKIEEKMSRAIKLHDEAWDKEERAESLGIGDIHLLVKPFRSAPLEVNTRIREYLYNETKGEDVVDLDVNSIGLCRGEDLRSSKVKAWLFCWLEFKIHPVYTIAPLKMEFLDRYPTIVQIHDAFSPADTDELISRAGTMRPSVVGGKDTERSSFHRYSSNSWLPPKSSLKISRKIETMLRLNVTSKRAAELTQVVSYTIGGHYRNHLDSVAVDCKVDETALAILGDRIATFMIYLNTVELGGLTAFPTSLTFSKPVRGSAVFWFNVLSDGSFDSATAHSACPVIIGEKWIATKWIRNYDQFRTRPCLLNSNERFQFPVNGKYLPLPEDIRQKLTDKDEQALKDLRTTA